MRATAALALGLCALAMARGARAQGRAEPASDGDDDAAVHVRARSGEAEARALEGGARAAQRVDLRPRRADAESVAALLDEVPGLHARSTGDGLAPTALSLRGAPAAHVTVALDGVPLNDALGGGVDLSLVPPALLESADVYRGVAPVRLGLAGLAGAVELRSRPLPLGARARLEAGAGYGSFAQRRAHLAAAARGARASGLLALSYRGTQGDLRYYDDNATQLDARDDRRDAVRENNAADAAELLARGCYEPGPVRACALVLAGARRRGLPGPGARPLREPSLEQARALVRASLQGASAAGASWELALSASARLDRYRDPRREAGGAAASDTQAEGLELLARAVLARGPLRAEPVARARVERAGARTLDASAPSAQGATRVELLAGFDARLALGPLTLAPSLGALLYADAPDAPDAPSERASAPTALLSPRALARVPLGPHLALRGGLAQLVRAPSLLERYGVGAFLVANPALRPERAQGAELGLVLEPRLAGRAVRLRAELTAFARGTDDLIVLVRSGSFGLKAINLRRAEALGAELAARLALYDRFTAVLAFAQTHAVQRAPGSPSDGRRVPNAPASDLLLRLEARLGGASVYAELAHTSGVYFDEANVLPAPARTLLGAGAQVPLPGARGWEARVLATNLLDQRDGLVTSTVGRGYSFPQPIADFDGYPLPGRALFFSIGYRPEAP